MTGARFCAVGLALVLVAGVAAVPAMADERVDADRTDDAASAAAKPPAPQPAPAPPPPKVAATLHDPGPALNMQVKSPYHARAGGKGVYVVSFKRSVAGSAAPATSRLRGGWSLQPFGWPGPLVR